MQQQWHSTRANHSRIQVTVCIRWDLYRSIKFSSRSHNVQNKTKQRKLWSLVKDNALSGSTSVAFHLGLCFFFNVFDDTAAIDVVLVVIVIVVIADFFFDFDSHVRD